MSSQAGNDEQKSDRDVQWLMLEASWSEFWTAVDGMVDWMQKREQLARLLKNGDGPPPETAVDEE